MDSMADVTTTGGETFTFSDSAKLAALIHKRFGRDVTVSAAAYRRLLANNVPDDEFLGLATAGEGFSGTQTEAQIIETAFVLRDRGVFDARSGDEPALTNAKLRMGAALDADCRDAFARANAAASDSSWHCPDCHHLLDQSDKATHADKCEAANDMDEQIELLATAFMTSRPKVYSRDSSRCGVEFDVNDLTALLRLARNLKSGDGQ
jgi:hypothetical protein